MPTDSAALTLSSPSSPESSDDSKRLLALPVVRARLSVAAIKERILSFCKRATIGYKVSSPKTLPNATPAFSDVPFLDGATCPLPPILFSVEVFL